MKYYKWPRRQLILQLKWAKQPTIAEIAYIVTPRIENILQIAFIPTVTRMRIIEMLKAHHLNASTSSLSSRYVCKSFQQSSKILLDISACKCKELAQCVCPKDKKVSKQDQTFFIDQINRSNCYKEVAKDSKKETLTRKSPIYISKQFNVS